MMYCKPGLRSLRDLAGTLNLCAGDVRNGVTDKFSKAATCGGRTARLFYSLPTRETIALEKSSRSCKRAASLLFSGAGIDHGAPGFAPCCEK